MCNSELSWVNKLRPNPNSKGKLSSKTKGIEIHSGLVIYSIHFAEGERGVHCVQNLTMCLEI